MKLLERYILRRVLGVFLAALFSVLAIVWTTQVMERIDLVTDSGQSVLAFLELATLMLPQIVPEVIPFAIAIAAAHTLTTMNNDSELAVINAAGSSRLVIIRPILLLALAASITSFLFMNALDPMTKKRFREILATAHANLLSTVIQEGSFRRIEEGLFIQIGERLPGGRFGEIVLVDSREEGLELLYFAEEGEIVSAGDTGVLVMLNGEVHRSSADDEVSIIRFASYAFDLSAFIGGKAEITMFPKDRPLGYLVNPDPNDSTFQKTPQLYRAELHRRLTEWIYPLVFALIALAVAGDARSHREARLPPMLTALLMCLLVRWAGFFFGGKMQTSATWTPFLYLSIATGMALPIYFLLINRTMELQGARAERLLQFLASVRDLATGLPDRLGRVRVRGNGSP
jgi:lipopolysaccharide export system permease protein